MTGHHRAVIAMSCLALLVATPGQSSGPRPGPSLKGAADRAVEEMQRAAGSALRVERSRGTGLVRFLAAPKSRGIVVRSGGTADQRALSFVGQFGPAFGLEPGSVRVIRVSRSDDSGLEHVRLQQQVEGIPVAGGEAILHLRGDMVTSILARTVPDLERVRTTPVLEADEASSAARALLVKHLSIDGADLSTPRLEIFNPSLLDGGPWRPSRLAWFVEAQTFDRLEYIWVDAETGGVLLNFNQRPGARIRNIYDAESGSTLPGTLVRSEGEGDTGDVDADLAYLFSGDTYDYYWNEHDRDSYDDAGATLESTVHFCPSAEDCPYGNAFWNGSRMVYGDGFASADDVVAHELTHAVTSETAGLYYYMQSGALNESFSDIFGETVDLANGHGSDAPGDRWLMGEDLTAGAIRDMWEPNTYLQPATLSDPWFFCDPDGDQGGVHYNSGVPNLAYALSVDGGSFNGYSVTGIGLTKAGKVQYRVLTEYLVSGSDFADYHDAVNQACADLVGTADITAADCSEIATAMQAVEIDDPWPCLPAQSNDPVLCAVGETPVDLFFDDIDTSMGDGWTITTSNLDDPNCRWYLFGAFATSGSVSLYGPDSSEVCVTDVRMTSNIAVPPTGAMLRFNHAFGLEEFLGGFYDAAFVVYSTDSGANWYPADCTSCQGLPYVGTVATGSGNLMEGEAAFVADSFGFTVSQLDLAPFAGQNVRFGFRVSTDSSVGDQGWWLDDIRVFECVAVPADPIFDDGFEFGDTSAWSATAGGP